MGILTSFELVMPDVTPSLLGGTMGKGWWVHGNKILKYDKKTVQVEGSKHMKQ